MTISEELVRRRLHEDAERIRVSPLLNERTAGRRRSPNAVRVRALAITTGAALVLLVGLAASVLVGEGAPAPQPAAGQSDDASAYATVPSPPGLSIRRPANDVSPRLAAFSGTWEGIWNRGGRPSRLIVEEVTKDSAGVVYAWGSSREFGLQPGWQRITAHASRDGRIEFGTPTPGTDQIGECNAAGCIRVRFSFLMSDDQKTITGTRDFRGPAGTFLASVTMRRARTPSSGRAWLLVLTAVGLVALGAAGGIAGQRAWARVRRPN